MTPPTVLAEETGTITVNDNVATVLWGDSVPKLATQGVYMTIPLQVYSPADDTTGCPGYSPSTTAPKSAWPPAT